VKVRVVNQPSGLVNGAEWPAAGELVDLPDSVAEGMVASGDAEEVKAEKPKAEKRPAAKSDKVEKRG
jgi:hypothetical protein